MERQERDGPDGSNPSSGSSHTVHGCDWFLEDQRRGVSVPPLGSRRSPISPAAAVLSRSETDTLDSSKRPPPAPAGGGSGKLMLAGGGGSLTNSQQIRGSLAVKPSQSGSASRCFAASRLPRERESTLKERSCASDLLVLSRKPTPLQGRTDRGDASTASCALSHECGGSWPAPVEQVGGGGCGHHLASASW